MSAASLVGWRVPHKIAPPDPTPVLLMHFDGDFVDATGNTAFSAAGTYSFPASETGFGQRVRHTESDVRAFGLPAVDVAIGTQKFTLEGRSTFGLGDGGGVVLAKNYWAEQPNPSNLFKDDFSFSVTPTQIGVGWEGQVGNFTAPVSSTTGVPFAWAICDDGLEMRFYVDGVLVETRASVAAASPPPPSTPGSGISVLNKLQGFLGSAPNWVPGGYAGALDELRLTLGYALYAGNSYVVRSTPFPYP